MDKEKSLASGYAHAYEPTSYPAQLEWIQLSSMSSAVRLCCELYLCVGVTVTHTLSAEPVNL